MSIKCSEQMPLGVIRNLLREKWTLRERVLMPTFDFELRETIQTLRHQSENIETVRKDRVFDSEITEDEMEIIAKRVALQQQQFQEYQKREEAKKIARIKTMFPYLSNEEVREALNEAEENEETVILNFTQPQYLMTIRKKIALKYKETITQPTSMTLEQREAYSKLLEKRRTLLKRTTDSDAKKKTIKYTRLGLDDALQQLQKGSDPSKMFEGWSDARIRAYQQIESKPNSYYYRFNAPGEKQMNGVWTKAERELFYKRLNEMGADGQWGIFSMTIPGRVGYQVSLYSNTHKKCSNFYRLLVKTGEIKDDNYVIDDKGELRYLFGKKEGGKGVIRTHIKTSFHGGKPAQSRKPKAILSVSEIVPLAERSKPVKKRKRQNQYDSGDEDEEDAYEEENKDTSGTYKVSSRSSRRAQSENQEVFNEQDIDPNPLPGFIDPITLEEVVKPAISPYGHVMGYDSWLRCLNSEDRKNICPMTKKPLNKRELIVLTHDNIDAYREQIVNK